MDPTHRLIVAPYSESSPSLLSHAAGAGQRRAAQDLGLPVDEQGWGLSRNGVKNYSKRARWSRNR